MFPTGVGMNRGPCADGSTVWDVPHRRGDEPVANANYAWGKTCSPQAWG